MRSPAAVNLAGFSDENAGEKPLNLTASIDLETARLPTSKTSAPSVRTAFQTVCWLRALPPACAEALVSVAQVRTVARNRVLLDVGEYMPGLMVLLSGQVHAERLVPQDKVAVLRDSRAGDCLAEIELLDGGPSNLRWRAVKTSQVLLVPIAVFKSALHHHVSLAHSLSQRLCDQVRRSNKRIHMLACLPVEERVLWQLRAWAHLDDLGRGLLHGPPSQIELARAVGASREMTSRSIARLKKIGLLQYENWSAVQVCMGEGLVGR